ncbi:SLC13 family permease [Lactobacillus sp. R2/2]|nr:SLC13 family permease [Lactobacillus sp. R2/2]
MSNTLMIATVIILLIISFVLYKKIPIQFILIFLPILGALALGLDINKINNLALNFMVQTMRSIGFMMLFGLMYFTMLSKTGMFEQIIEWIMRPFNKKLNNWIIMILTTVISMIAMLTATPTATYLIVFPIMVALYDKVKFDKRVAMIIAQTGISTMLFFTMGTRCGYFSNFCWGFSVKTIF